MADIITKAVSSEVYKQGGIAVNQGGINFAEKNNDLTPATQKTVDTLDIRLERQNSTRIG